MKKRRKRNLCETVLKTLLLNPKFKKKEKEEERKKKTRKEEEKTQGFSILLPSDATPVARRTKWATPCSGYRLQLSVRERTLSFHSGNSQ